MAKIRVHELAKEMGLNSRDLVQRLQDSGIQVKNHFSTLEEAEVASIKNQAQRESSASKKSGQREAIKKETEAERPDSAMLEPKVAPAGTRSRPSGKAGETTKSGPSRSEERGSDRRMTSSRNDGPIRDQGNESTSRGSVKQTSLEGALNTVSPGSTGAVNERPAGNRPAGERQPMNRPSGDRPPMNRPQGDRPPMNRPQGDRQPMNRPPGDRQPMNRPQGDRQAMNRPQGDRQPMNRPQGDRPPMNRPQGDRQPMNRPQGDRPPMNRPQGDRQPMNRPQGDRPPMNRPQGDRPPMNRPQGDRPPMNRPQGDRPSMNRPGMNRPPMNRPPGDRPTGNYGDRPANRPAGPRSGSPRPAAVPPVPVKPTGRAVERDKAKIQDDSFQNRGAGKGAPTKKTDPKRPINRPPSGRDRIVSLVDDDSMGGRGRKKPGRPGSKGSRGKATPRVTAPSLPKIVTIGKSVTVQDLAGALNRTSADLIKRLMSLGVMVTATQTIDFDTAAIVCGELGVEAQPEITQEEALIPDIVDDPAIQKERPPVVTVMGHVDHGKTSLLDAIRKTKVTASEAGGITQHIGAYQVEINGKKITFIDTPGHEAFTSMRARGAQVTDIAILVVAADDGVMPQTIEAINHARAAEVPIIVAINKIDKPEANPERIKQQLTEYGLLAEDWGGDTICVPVSAHSREGLDTLLEMILLVAEMGDIQANPDRPAKGTVIEGQLDKGRGPVATVLVQHGTLRVGDSVLVGLTYGKVRAMVDHRGEWLKEAAPSTPVEVLGLDGVPMAGDILQVVSEEKIARQITETRQDQRREEEMHKSVRVTLDDLFKQIKEGQIKELNVIIKGDVQGSIEALRQSLEKLSTDEVRVNMVHTGVGTINENDVMLAAASNAIIIGFNVRPDHNTRRAAEQEQVDIRLYRVIYEAVNDVKAAMSGLLDPEWKEVVLGRAEVRATFKVPKVGMIAGCYVLDGKMVRGAEVRVLRDGVIIQEGKIDSLRRFKDDVKEVMQAFECGIGIEKFNDVKEGDIFEDYMMERIERSL